MKLVSNLSKVEKMIQDAIASSLEEVGKTVVAEAQLRTPVKTGQLRRSLTYKTEANLKKVTIGTNIDYSEIIHNGNSTRKAQPFLTDAINSNITEIETIFKKHLKGIGEYKW